MSVRVSLAALLTTSLVGGTLAASSERIEEKYVSDYIFQLESNASVIPFIKSLLPATGFRAEGRYRPPQRKYSLGFASVWQLKFSKKDSYSNGFTSKPWLQMFLAGGQLTYQVWKSKDSKYIFSSGGELGLGLEWAHLQVNQVALFGYTDVKAGFIFVLHPKWSLYTGIHNYFLFSKGTPAYSVALSVGAGWRP